jgi:hypothetical protein
MFDEQFNAALAIDDIQLVDCALCYPEVDCQQSQFHCDNSRCCVEDSVKCDFADDCGDRSDEEEGTCGETYLNRINFEDPMFPWGFWDNSNAQALTGDFVWQRGNGSGALGPGGGDIAPE